MDESDIFSNETPNEYDSVSESEILDEEEEENETFYNEDSGYHSSYYPFPSKIFALLYLLVNSPHPLVSLLYLV